MKIDLIKPTASVFLADQARKMEMGGAKIIKLQTGDPDFATHPAIIQAAYNSLEKGDTHYSFANGLPEFRQLIAAELSMETETSVSSEQILVTHGAAEGIYASLAALLEYGDEVIICEPAWPTVGSLVSLLGGIARKIGFLEGEQKFLLDLKNAINQKTKLICINTPNNPTGVVFSQYTLNEIASICQNKNIYLLADEVYRFLVHLPNLSTTVQQLSRFEKFIFIDSFSKKYAMTGWRLGYVASSPEVIRKIAKASQLTITHVAPFIQRAGVEALSNRDVTSWTIEMKKEYRTRKELITNQCHELELDFINNDGAFYFFISLKGLNDELFADKLLKDKKVCAVPGSAYGTAGANFIRITYATNLELVNAGLNKIKELMLELNGK